MIHWKFLQSLLLIFLLSPVALCQSIEENNSVRETAYRIIFSMNVIHNAKPHEVKAIAQVLANHLKDSENFSQGVEVVIASDREEIVKITREPFDLIVLSTQEYYELKNQIMIEPVFVNLTRDHTGNKYYLLVNKADEINDIKQLNGKSLTIHSPKDLDVPLLWLDKLLKDKKLTDKKKFFKEINFEDRVINVVLPVFFKKVKAAIVSESGLKLVTELNPQIGKELTILAESENIIVGLGCANTTDYGQTRRKNVLNALFNLQNNSYGKQILDLFATDKIIPFKEEYLTEYLRLKK